jgi:hypothetical protein
MRRPHVFIIAILAALSLPAAPLGSQVIRGPTDHTTCPTPFRPIAGLTFHAGKAWNVTYHTFPYQYGFAQYSALPDPATSEDGRATWTNPGAYAECTNTWFYNPNGSVAFVEFRWHVIDYRGEVTASSGGCEGDGGQTDPIYMMSYDPYVPEDQAGEVSVLACGGGGGGSSGGGGVTCRWEWMEIEISYDGGQTWQSFWSGWGQMCEQQAT